MYAQHFYSSSASFFRQGHDKCLIDKPQYQFKKSDKLPGEIYSPEMQCKLTYGKNSSLCSFKVNHDILLWVVSISRSRNDL